MQKVILYRHVHILSFGIRKHFHTLNTKKQFNTTTDNKKPSDY